MARGFESKDVEFQQAEAERQKAARRALTPDERAASDRRRAVELSLARARAELATARTAAHRQMLNAAITSLEERLVQEKT
jgi:MoxR-like ATPase